MIKFIFGRFKPMEGRALPQILGFSLVMLAARLLLAMPFWASGQTRWVSFPTKITSSTLYLFQNEFVLHFGFFEMPIPFPVFVSWMTGLAEVILPVLLVLGILTRFGALALLGMSIVIQLVFPDGFINVTDPMNSHALWMVYAVLIMICGPGWISFDGLVRRLMFAPRSAVDA